MPYQPTTNFRDSNGVDLGKKLVSKDYLLEVYGSILDSLGNSGLTVTPSLWTWGSNSNGQLGINDLTNRNTPVTTILGGVNWESIAAGSTYTVAIKADGTLWTWGNNAYGQLGVNDTTSRSTPVTTLLGGTNWRTVSGCASNSSNRIIALKSDGTLWNWGRNEFGQLGVNDSVDRNTPVTTILGGTNWKSISSGGRHTLAIKTDGTLWSWGNNAYGALGVNDTITRSTPVTTILGETNWKAVAGGGGLASGFTSAIKTDGSLWTWGRNSSGVLGVNDITNRSTPVTTILGGNDWKFVAGANNIAAIKTDGTLWIWGDSSQGQLGVDSTVSRSTPVTTLSGGTNWKFVSCGQQNMAAIKTNGSLWTWGLNTSGQLGIDDTTRRNTPVTTILGGTNWKSVFGGSITTLAIQSVDYI